LTLVCSLTAACADPAPLPVPVQPEVVKSIKRYSAQYVLAPGDQVEVSVFRVPEASHSSVVRPDGYISLPIVKDVKAAGLTVSELNKQLTRLYGERLVDPDVTVAVANPREAPVYVVGEVVKPGPLPVRSAPTAAAAIAGSGGVPHSADLDNVAVIRLNDDGYMTGYVLERKNSGQAAFYAALSTTLLMPGDILVVPENGRSQFVRFIQDFVNTPLGGVNSVLNPYFQFRLIHDLEHPVQ
jgi:polysaccharide export outer membrane protein